MLKDRPQVRDVLLTKGNEVILHASAYGDGLPLGIIRLAHNAKEAKVGDQPHDKPPTEYRCSTECKVEIDRNRGLSVHLCDHGFVFSQGETQMTKGTQSSNPDSDLEIAGIELGPAARLNFQHVATH